MTQQLINQEIAIVIAVKNNNPTMINLEFLQQSGLIPNDWKLAQKPVFNNQISQLIFEHGFSIVAQPDRVMFLEALNGQNIDQLQSGTIAKKYLQLLPLADYQAVGNNFRGFVPYQNDPKGANQYISTKLLNPSASWQNFGNDLMRANLNLIYTLDGRQLNLSVSEAIIQTNEESTIPVVLFGSNFSYDVSRLDQQQKIGVLTKAIDNCLVDFKIYNDLINQKFLNIENTDNLPTVLNVEKIG